MRDDYEKMFCEVIDEGIREGLFIDLPANHLHEQYSSFWGGMDVGYTRDPSEILISQKDSQLSGITIGATLEGNRPLLIEIQSLVSPASYGTPQRTPTGFDHKRLNMLLAVLEKRCGFRMVTTPTSRASGSIARGRGSSTG